MQEKLNKFCGSVLNAYICIVERTKEMSKTIDYHREPTKGEIAFGYGATHYLTLDVDDPRIRKKDGTFKKWFLNKDDGLRYYY